MNAEFDAGGTCQVCHHIYDGDDHKMIVLRCGHLFGRSCIVQMFQDGQFQSIECPVCRIDNNVEHIRVVLVAKIQVQNISAEDKREKAKAVIMLETGIDWGADFVKYLVHTLVPLVPLAPASHAQMLPGLQAVTTLLLTLLYFIVGCVNLYIIYLFVYYICFGLGFLASMCFVGYATVMCYIHVCRHFKNSQ